MAQQVAQELVEAARGFGFEIRDPQRFAQNMARLIEETGKAVTAFVEPRVSNPAQALAGGGDFTHIMNALSQIQQAWLFQPQKLMEAQDELKAHLEEHNRWALQLDLDRKAAQAVRMAIWQS